MIVFTLVYDLFFHAFFIFLSDFWLKKGGKIDKKLKFFLSFFSFDQLILYVISRRGKFTYEVLF